MQTDREITQLKKIHNYVEGLFSADVSGHDFFHMKRVAKMAENISRQENANCFICEAAGWLHDVGDHKLFIDPQKALKDLDVFLDSIDLTNLEINQIKTAMKDVSFSKGRIPSTLEGKIVQDADRIDALGAIGIARTFAYGGSKGQAIFQDTANKNTSIQHFYDKLLVLKDSINTKSAKVIAAERHLFMEVYLDHFLKEWDIDI